MSKNKHILEVRDDDFQDIKQELKREGKKDNIVIKSLNIVTYPAQKLKQRYKIRYKFNKKHLLMDALIAAAVLVLIGINVFYWLGGFHYFVNKFDLNINVMEETVVSGGQTSFLVEYENNNKFTLNNGNLAVKFPENFILEDVSRTDFNRQDNTLAIGDLTSGANGSVIFVGKVIGAIDEDQSFISTFSYYKTNKKGAQLWGQFTDLERLKYSPDSSAINANINLPARIVSQQEFVLPINLVNNTGLNIDEIVVVPESIEGFEVVTKSESYLDNAWHFYQVVSGGEINLKPRVRIASFDEKVSLNFSVLLKYNGEYLKQFSFSKEKEMFNPEFYITHSIDKTTVQPGDQVKVSVTLDNQGDHDIEDVSLHLDLSGNYWNYKNLSTTKHAIVDQTAIFKYNDIHELTLIMPHEKKTIDLVLNVNNFIDGVINPELFVEGNVMYSVEGLSVFIRGEKSEVRVSSNLNIRAFARYYTKEGEQLGRGPLPPVIGESTKFWVFLQVLNDINAMQNVSLTASLPTGVTWENRSSVPVGNAVTYDANTRKISWSISKIKVDPTNIGVAFELGVVPTETQRGQYLNLLENIVVNGRDSFTGDPIIAKVNDVTTNLQFDEKGKVKGGLVR